MTLRYVKRGDVILPDDHNAIRQALIDLCDTVKANSPGAPDVQAKCDEVKAKVQPIRTVAEGDYVLASDHNAKREILLNDIPALWELVSQYQAEFVDKRDELISKASLILERKYGHFVLAEDHNNVISALELAKTQAEQVNIPVSVIWLSDLDALRVYELSPVDWAVIRSAPSPYTHPWGIGGKRTIIWHCDEDAMSVYELSVKDFSVIRQASSPYFWPYDIGGDEEVIWHCDNYVDIIYELSITDFSVVKSAGAPSPYTMGVGGSKQVVWHSESYNDRIYELSTVDFSVIRYGSSPEINPGGIGGRSERIWHCNGYAKMLYELSVEDFSVLRQNPSPDAFPHGIGGA